LKTQELLIPLLEREGVGLVWNDAPKVPQEFLNFELEFPQLLDTEALEVDRRREDIPFHE
jgi:hypothetical protein